MKKALRGGANTARWL